MSARPRPGEYRRTALRSERGGLLLRGVESPVVTATMRLATPDDAAAVRDIYAPFARETPITFEEEPPSVAAVRDRIESRLRRYPWLICERGGEVAGYAAAGELRSMAAYDWTVELSVYVADGHRRAGVGQGLYTSLLAALDRQGFRSAYAAVTVPNPGSDRLHESLGFDRVGEFPNAGYSQGEWRDVRWWYRPVGDPSPESDPAGRRKPPSDPDPPLSLSESREEPGWKEALAAGESLVSG